MNILVTGSDGQLGRSLRRASEGSGDRYIFTDIGELDITDAAAVRAMVLGEKVDAIVNCAAYTNVEAAEDNPGPAHLLNAEAPGILAAAAKEAGALLIHISTDYVFGGEFCNTPCPETMSGSPVGVYGQTKLEGEKAVTGSGCRFIIIRTAWLYSEYGRNFLATMLRLTSERPEVNVVFDQVGTPTYAFDLAGVIFKILEERLYEGREGFYHYTDEGVCSWYDFAGAIASFAGHDSCCVLPCHSGEFPSKVRRPAYSVLDKTKIKAAFGIRIPHWTESLKACLSNMDII